MNIKKASISLFLLLSIPLFSQEVVENGGFEKVETKLSYLDSVKETFVKDNMATCVDSLWLKELTNLDLYDDLSEDIRNIDVDENVDYELSTELLKLRLKAMDAKSPFNIEYNQGLENIIKSFLKYRKKSFERLMAVSEYYFPQFEEAFAKKNVPLEIKYLAVVESALNPKAVSRMGATGLWQFMYQTGKQYNLKIDSYVDERSDPIKSSEAAAQYMANMYTIFGDWELVLASYNSGPGNVSKAIRRSGGQQNYWNIRKNLPKETQGYVPAFLATMYIYEYHNEHGIVPDRALVKHFATDTIMIKKQMSFKQISDLLDVPIKQLQLLNPSYKLNVIPFYGDQNHFLRLPLDKLAIFTSNEDKIYAYVQDELDGRERPYSVTKAIAEKESDNNEDANEDVGEQMITVSKTKYYKVKRGDNLSQIANKYNVSVSNLKTWNKLKGSYLVCGESLKIITKERIVSAEVKNPKNSNITSKVKQNNQKTTLSETKNNKEEIADSSAKGDTLLSKNKSFYVVQKGDNLGSIAKAYQITTAEIQKWNHLSGYTVRPGTSLRIAKKELENNEELASTPETEEVEVEDVKYVVQKEDNLWTISKKFGTSLVDLKQWNNLSDHSIALGSTLIVKKAEKESNTTIETFKKKDNLKLIGEYYVKKGDSLYSISKKYPGVTISDIKKWNGIKEEELKPGMKLKING